MTPDSSQPESVPDRAPEAELPLAGMPGTNADSARTASAYPPVMSPAGFAYGTPFTPGQSLPAARPRASRRRLALVAVSGAALAAALVVGGVGIGDAVDGASPGSVSSNIGSAGSGTSGNGNSGSGAGGSTAQGSNAAASETSTATAAEQSGVVTIVSTLGYENAESAGTGLVLTSSGEIVTNNHVVSGATSVVVTVESTGRSYRATVVGTDATDDIAVLQLTNASGLTVAKTGDSADASVSTAVVAVGNAGGTGTLTVATGKITALKQSITATDESGSEAENLTGLIETDADVVAGDSGGPLYDAAGDIVGIDTAGSSASAGSGAQASAVVTAQSYAIPIDTALHIAAEIESGTRTASIQIGLPAFLGVETTQSDVAGATVVATVAGGPAADAGITAGSVITAVDGKTVSSASSLQTRLASFAPGDRVTIAWTDATGTSHTATVTLVSGAAA